MLRWLRSFSFRDIRDMTSESADNSGLKLGIVLGKVLCDKGFKLCLLQTQETTRPPHTILAAV